MEYLHLNNGLSLVSRRDLYLVLNYFLIYINDLCLVYKHTSSTLFANDINLFPKGKDFNILELVGSIS